MFLKSHGDLSLRRKEALVCKENGSVNTKCTYGPRFEDEHVVTSWNRLDWTPVSIWEHRGQKGEGHLQIHPTESAELGPGLSFPPTASMGATLST